MRTDPGEEATVGWCERACAHVDLHKLYGHVVCVRLVSADLVEEGSYHSVSNALMRGANLGNLADGVRLTGAGLSVR